MSSLPAGTLRHWGWRMSGDLMEDVALIDGRLRQMLDELVATECDCSSQSLVIDATMKAMAWFMFYDANGMTPRQTYLEVKRRWPDVPEHTLQCAVHLADALCAMRADLFDRMGIEHIPTRRTWH